MAVTAVFIDGPQQGLFGIVGKGHGSWLCFSGDREFLLHRQNEISTNSVEIGEGSKPFRFRSVGIDRLDVLLRVGDEPACGLKTSNRL